MIECPFCDSVVDSRSDYENHFNRQHTDDVFVDRPNGLRYTCRCDYCESTFERPWAQIDSNQFCSLDCHTEYRSFLDDRLSRRYFKEQREIARERDNYVCQGCAVGEWDISTELHVHHIIPRGRFDNPKEAHDVDNLVSLCPSCHKKWEGVQLKPILEQ